MIRRRVFQLPKGLTRAAAIRAALARCQYREFRGFSYNPKTGRAVIV